MRTLLCPGRAWPRAGLTVRWRRASALCRSYSRRTGIGGGLAKFAAVELACRLTGLTQRDVGQRYGNITSAAVSITGRKIRTGVYPLKAIVERLEEKILRHPGGDS